MKYHYYWNEKPPINKFCLFVARMPIFKPGEEVKIRIRFVVGMANETSLISINGGTIDPYEFDRWISFDELDEILMEYRN